MPVKKKATRASSGIEGTFDAYRFLNVTGQMGAFKKLSRAIATRDALSSKPKKTTKEKVKLVALKNKVSALRGQFREKTKVQKTYSAMKKKKGLKK